MRGLAGLLLPRILSALEILSATLLFVMMALTFVDVIGRYLFTAPVFGAAEMIQFLLAMTIFGGLSLVNADDSHITVDLFGHLLDRWIPRVRRLLVQSFSVFVMIIIAYQLFELAVEAQALGKTTVVLEWPLVLVAGAVAALSVISLIAQLLGLTLPPQPAKTIDHASRL